MSAREEVRRCLISARAERTASRCKQVLESAISLCEEWEESGGGAQAAILKAQALAQIAFEENATRQRLARWDSALKSLERHRSDCRFPEVAETYSVVAVDRFQDDLAGIDPWSKARSLRTARDYLDTALEQVSGSAKIGILLARKSSVLRHLAMTMPLGQPRLHRVEESLRCAERAAKETRECGTLLELGLAEWALARYQTTDEKYVCSLRNAEAQLNNDMLQGFEPAQLALARFYRLSFRPVEACEVFCRLTEYAEDVRRVLRNSFVYAEAAIQLSYGQYPKQVVDRHLSQSRSLVESALAAGYRNARLIIALAFLVAIQEGSPAGETALADICGENAGVSWQDALRVVLEADLPDIASLGFALGIDQAGVMTRIGTFAWDFLSDASLAETLYRMALRLDPHDPVALTNLARFLVAHPDESSLRESQRLLQQAQNFADRRFRWWRSVLAEVEEKQRELGYGSRPAKRGEPGRRVPPASRTVENLKQVTRQFRSIATSSDRAQRGYELEKVIYELARLTFKTSAPPYRIKRAGNGCSQIDGYFEHGGEKYRLECKWEKEPAEPGDVDAFLAKLDAAGLSGLLISMSGFTQQAVGRAWEYRNTKPIILMDGDEMRAVAEGRQNFDEVITKKRLGFDLQSEPYYKVRCGQEPH